MSPVKWEPIPKNSWGLKWQIPNYVIDSDNKFICQLKIEDSKPSFP